MLIFSDEGAVKEIFDVNEHVKKVVHDAFEQCDTSQVCSMRRGLSVL